MYKTFDLFFTLLIQASLEVTVNELQQGEKEKEKLSTKIQSRDKDFSAKQFVESVKRGLGPHSPSKQVTESAAITCVKLCKASTYVNISDSNNAIFKLVQYVINDLKSLLFNPVKPFSRGQGYNFADIELMIDCWVSCFRINPHNIEALKVCLNLNSPQAYHFVIVCSLLRYDIGVMNNFILLIFLLVFFFRLAHIYVDFRLQNKNPFRIVNQPHLPWWPQTEVVHYRSSELRALFTDTLNKATQGYIAHTPLRMITSLTLKTKDTQKGLTRSEEVLAHKMLLLLLVRLIHADPTLLLNVIIP